MVLLIPNLVETAPVISMATPVTAKYVVKSKVTSLGVAPNWLAIAGKIGSTSPRLINAIIAVKKTAHTAFGWLSIFSGLSVELVDENIIFFLTLVL